jgi:hypothetical protein
MAVSLDLPGKSHLALLNLGAFKEAVKSEVKIPEL